MRIKVTIKDIADFCGVSITTVSFVLNGKYSELSEETVEKVLGAIKELGYSRNEIARSLVTNKTHTIAVILPDITNRFYANIAKSISKISTERNYSILLCDTDRSLEIEKNQIQIFENRNIDGIIIASRNAQLLLDNFKNYRNVPIVIVDEEVHELAKNVLTVYTYNQVSSYKLTEYLINLGHKSFFVIEGLVDSTNNKYRKNGFYKALKDYDIDEKNSKFVRADYQMTKAYNLTLSAYEEKYSAIIAFNDLMAYGAIKALNERLIKVPENVSVVGFDAMSNIELVSKLSSIELTSINQAEKEIGKIAAESLIDQIEGKRDFSLNQEIALEATLFEGNTTKRLR